MDEETADSLMGLVASWRARADAKLRDAAPYPEGSMERRALINAAMNNLNCAAELAARIATTPRKRALRLAS